MIGFCFVICIVHLTEPNTIEYWEDDGEDDDDEEEEEIGGGCGGDWC
jgi:hypothetical protein